MKTGELMFKSKFKEFGYELLLKRKFISLLVGVIVFMHSCILHIYINCFYLLYSFQKQLIGIETHINQRNVNLVASNNPEQVQEYPYEWLRPTNVLNSISN